MVQIINQRLGLEDPTFQLTPFNQQYKLMYQQQTPPYNQQYQQIYQQQTHSDKLKYQQSQEIKQQQNGFLFFKPIRDD